MQHLKIYSIIIIILLIATIGSSEESNYVTEPVFNSKMFIYEKGDKNNTSVVLVHGVGDIGSKIWKDTIPILEKKYHLIVLDLPGFAKSEKKNVLYSPATYSKLLTWVIEKYVKKKDYYLVGHSLGAAISLYHSSKSASNLKKLVIIDSPGIIHRAAYSKDIAKINSGNYSIFSNPINTINNIIGYSIESFDSIAPKKLDNILNSNLLRSKIFKGKTGAIAGAALFNTDYSKVIQNLKIPVSLIWGENDTIAPVRTAKMLHSMIHDSELEIITSTAHNPMIEDADQFNKILLEVLARKKIIHKGNSNNGQYKTIHYKDEGLTLVLNGNFKKVTIENCSDIIIEDAHINTLIVKNSVISIFNTKILSKKTAAIVENSIFKMTGGTISGKSAIKSSCSSFDLAGVKIHGHKSAISEIDNGCTKGSRFIFSVCNIKSNTSTGSIHESVIITKDNSDVLENNKRNTWFLEKNQ